MSVMEQRVTMVGYPHPGDMLKSEIFHVDRSCGELVIARGRRPRYFLATNAGRASLAHVRVKTGIR